MSTDDLSPMLPQSGDDNAPMISGRGTKIIADARGAYLAGNLDSLIGRMDETQQLQFRQSLVSQGLQFVERLLPDIGTSSWLTSVELTKHWLRVPTKENAFNAQRAVPTTQPFYPLVMLVVIGTSAADLGSIAKGIAVETSRMLIAENRASIQWAIKRWTVDTAWAILTRSVLPPFDLSDGIERAYRTGDTKALTDLMDHHQQTAFWKAITQYVVHLAEKITPDGDIEYQCIQAVYRWICEPTQENVQTVKAVQSQLTPHPEQRRDKKRIAAFRLAEIVCAATLEAALEQSRSATELVLWATNQDRDNARDKLDWWQVEVAWAILQGTDIPPFPEPPS